MEAFNFLPSHSFHPFEMRLCIVLRVYTSLREKPKTHHHQHHLYFSDESIEF
jgi:hypothetical protein